MIAKIITASVFLVGMLLSSCGVTPANIENRNAVLGERPSNSNFFEAQQINAIEDWKDDPGKIVNVYIINPQTGGLLIPAIQCQGVPASSTESLEPNHGVPYYNSGSGTYWRIPIDGYDTGTDEMAGRDGTFGDPVPFRQCMSVDGNYYDWSIYSTVLVSSASYTFPDATVKRDFEDEARLLKAEEVIKRGGCVNYETLEEVPCGSGNTYQEPTQSVTNTQTITQ